MVVYFLCAFLAAVNLFAFLLFWLDQIQARGGLKRIAPAKLLLVAALGGWPGAKLAQYIFQHCPTSKTFFRLLNAVPVLWMAMIFTVTAASTFLPEFVPEQTPSQVAENDGIARETPKFFSSVQN